MINQSSPSVKESMASTKKYGRWEKHIGHRVEVADFGFGVLKYFTAETELKVCGVALDEPNGDCNGCDAEGTEFFSCADGHGIFVEMKSVTLCDENDKPIPNKKPAAKKTTSSKPKKKFDSPPSLRKTINRKSTTSTTPLSRSSTASDRNTPSSKTRPSERTGGAKKKQNHLAAPKSGVIDSVKGMMGSDRKVIRRQGGDAADRTLKTKETREESEQADRDAADSGNASAEQHTASVLDVPEDWVEAAKREKREAEEKLAREKELADIEAQEERMRLAAERQLEEERLFNEKAAEEAAKRDAARAERLALREKQAAERAAARERSKKDALVEINEYAKLQEKEKQERDLKEKKQQEDRQKQKDRIKALMSRVRTATTRGQEKAATAPGSPARSDDSLSPAATPARTQSEDGTLDMSNLSSPADL
eukprot:m.95465 g.95465  ORF g.95465 m.95465 type:complete len:424 (-) comp16596_c0_seq1:185-1456(-)